jgi:hypothetical protein
MMEHKQPLVVQVAVAEQAKQGQKNKWQRRKLWWFLAIILLCPLFLTQVRLAGSLTVPQEDQDTLTTSFLESALPDFSSDRGPQQRERLNIVVLYPDDWRHDSLHMAGKVNPYVHTPFLDELAEKGVRFSKNCVTTSICWVSRATLWTGQYASRHKSWYIYKTAFYDKWNETYPGILRQNGYHVGHIGKWQYKNPKTITDNQYDFMKECIGTRGTVQRFTAVRLLAMTRLTSCVNDPKTNRLFSMWPFIHQKRLEKIIEKCSRQQKSLQSCIETLISRNPTI